MGIDSHSCGGTEMGNTILFVDDEVVILNALKAVFVREGFQVLTATSGEEALKILENQDVDVVVSDERMPGISGIELLSIVKEKYPDKIRIVLTAYAELNTMLSAINKVETHRLIVKPYRNDEIVQTVHDLMTRQQTVRKNEKALEEANREADFAYKAAKIMCGSKFSLQDKYSRMIHLLRNYIGAQTLSLMLINPEQDHLVVQAATNDKVVGIKRNLQENSVSTWVAREGRSYRYNENDEKSPPAVCTLNDQSLTKYKNNSFLSVPVSDEMNTIGVFNVANPNDGWISTNTESTVSHLMRWVGAMVQYYPIDA